MTGKKHSDEELKKILSEAKSDYLKRGEEIDPVRMGQIVAREIRLKGERTFSKQPILGLGPVFQRKAAGIDPVNTAVNIAGLIKLSESGVSAGRPLFSRKATMLMAGSIAVLALINIVFISSFNDSWFMLSIQDLFSPGSVTSLFSTFAL